MITVEDISNIKNYEVFFYRVKVKRVGKDVFDIITFRYGDEELRGTEDAAEVAKFLNGYGI